MVHDNLCLLHSAAFSVINVGINRWRNCYNSIIKLGYTVVTFDDKMILNCFLQAVSTLHENLEIDSILCNLFQETIVDWIVNY